MNPLEIQIEDERGGVGRHEIPRHADETLQAFIARINAEPTLDADGHAIVELALGSATVLDESRRVGELKWLSQPIRMRRVCVEVHFEADHKQHKFPAQAKWARVHRWACRAFEVAHDACANLELRDGAPNGPPINERQEIGPHAGCKAVWLVKPGAEPNG